MHFIQYEINLCILDACQVRKPTASIDGSHYTDRNTDRHSAEWIFVIRNIDQMARYFSTILFVHILQYDVAMVGINQKSGKSDVSVCGKF